MYKLLLAAAAISASCHATAIELHRDGDSRLDLAGDISAHLKHSSLSEESQLSLTDTEFTLLASHRTGPYSEFFANLTLTPESEESFSDIYAKEAYVTYTNRKLGSVKYGTLPSPVSSVLAYTNQHKLNDYSIGHNNSEANGFDVADNMIVFETKAKARSHSRGETTLQVGYQSKTSSELQKTNHKYQALAEYRFEDLKLAGVYMTGEDTATENKIETYSVSFSKGNYGNGFYIAGNYGIGKNAFTDRFKQVLEDTSFYSVEVAHTLGNGVTVGANLHTALTGDDVRGGIFSNANFESYAKFGLSYPISKKAKFEMSYLRDLNGDGAFERKDVDHTLKAGLRYSF
ncbi:hypothetical protein [Vibrio owensii]|uniref:hypothetical protein n=1 Tax=Vibrio owensii TaxID=696485 RepID=UPI0018F239CB|nr:hypothetical protein [Vibrio owensii]